MEGIEDVHQFTYAKQNLRANVLSLCLLFVPLDILLQLYWGTLKHTFDLSQVDVFPNVQRSIGLLSAF